MPFCGQNSVAIFFQSDYNRIVMLYSQGKPDGMAAPDLTAARGRRVLIALSGGADSVALAVLLSEAQKDCALTLFAAHFRRMKQGVVRQIGGFVAQKISVRARSVQFFEAFFAALAQR